MSKLLESWKTAIQPAESIDAEAFLEQAAEIDGLTAI